VPGRGGRVDSHAANRVGHRRPASGNVMARGVTVAGAVMLCGGVIPPRAYLDLRLDAGRKAAVISRWAERPDPPGSR
jgi:hypothetical protein